MNERSVWISELNSEITSSAGGIILYGAGFNATFLIAKLKQINILCIADADDNKQGGQMSGIPIVSPESIIKYDARTCVVVTPDKYCLAITEKLNRLGFFNILYYISWNAQVIKNLDRKNKYIAENREQLGVLLKENHKKISAVREFLSHDDKSVAIFNAKLDSSFLGVHIPLEAFHEGNQYFPGDIINLSGREVFVDCGAYDGGTTLDFIRRAGEYSRIYVFEADPRQFECTKATLDYLCVNRFETYNLGVYSHQGELSFSTANTTGAAWITESGDITIPVNSLDALLYDKPDHPTFIKMDIEGAELEALEGSRRIIERDRPKMAISVYHGTENVHLWEIPYWIKSNYPDYKIYLRQHSNVNETICYAIPKK